MRRRLPALERACARVAGCEEWGVRVTRAPSVRIANTTGAAASGTAFLAARRRARDLSRSARIVAAEAADEAFQSLASIAREGRRRDDLPAGAAQPLLDAAFLVPVRRRARFHAAADRVARDVARAGGELTLTGPWPAYNFVARARA
jgi:hypothetical protein